MCFHSKQSKDAQAVEKRFKAKIEKVELFQSVEHYNGFSYPKTPVIIDKAQEIIKHFQWGLIPSWSKDCTIQKFTLNAKIETLAEKPSFKNSIIFVFFKNCRNDFFRPPIVYPRPRSQIAGIR